MMDIKKLIFNLVFYFSSLVYLIVFSQNNTNSQVLLQGFWWDFQNNNYENNWSDYLVELAPRLKSIGIDAVYIPPSIKNKASFDMGYAPFDHYDLGDKYQKGFLKTKFGDKDQLLRMVAVMKANGIDVIQDIVLNHITGAGSVTGNGGRDPAALDDGSTDKYKNFRYVCFDSPALNSTAGNYTSRKGRFFKNWQNFYPNNGFNCCTNEINTPYWGPDIAFEASSFGQSSNCNYNPAQSPNYMRDGMRNWLMWYKKQMGWDGVRIDAIKHFPTYVVEDFIWNLQHGNGWANGSDDMFAVGEWVGSSTELDQWCIDVQNRAGTFDFSLRNALTGIVQGNGNFDLGTVPNYQQSNRQRTVPFVNNHDTFRPILDNNGNYSGWNFSQQLGNQIEPNDPRLSVVYAIAFAVDGAPMVYFEDLFDIGYNDNRFDHNPADSIELPMRSDIKNIIWCHQNLGFKDGSYLVRWQENNALVIERDSKALIAVNDQWSNWKSLIGVQTNWTDGTVLKDYSGANQQTITVYGGGKVDILIPPCDGSSNLNRKGYCIWGPNGISVNYINNSESVTQEWEMADDLGDSHISSLMQGGKLPSSSKECRVVGKIHAKASSIVSLELYPSISNLSIDVLLLDSNCNPIDSTSGTGIISYDFNTQNEDIYTIQIRNSTANQVGQKCWVKVNYEAPAVPNLNIVKNKCACNITSSINNINIFDFLIYPNPVNDFLSIINHLEINNIVFSIIDVNGKIIKEDILSGNQISISNLDKGVYFLKINQKIKKFIKI